MGSEQTPEISVVIPVRNSSAHLEALLRSLRERGPRGIRYKVTVVDDGSEEELKPLCQKYEADYYRLEPGQGPAAARNKGAELARGRVLFFLDADVVYAAGAMERATVELDADPEVQAVSFLNQAYEPSDGVIKNYGAAIERYWFSPFIPPGETRGETPGITTRNVALRKEAFEAVGGFNPHFTTNALEDYDIGKRLAGRYKLIMVDAPNIYHQYPATLGRLLRNCFVRSALFVPYFMKHRPALDQQQVSGSEGLLRLVGTAGGVFLVAGVLPVLLQGLWLGLAIVCFGCYGIGVTAFLRAAWLYSGGWAFPFWCLWIHYVTSAAITLGAGWGLLHYLLRGLPLAGSGRSKP